MTIAIIGAGAAGLTAAWRLAPHHRVILFERDARLGGHAHTHDVVVDGQPVAVDTGFMVYNERTYPEFTALLAALGVETRASDMSFSVHCRRCDIEYASTGWHGLFARPDRALTPAHLSMLWEIRRFFAVATRALAGGTLGAESLGRFLDVHGFADSLVRHYVLPMGGAIWSASAATMREFPAASYLRFLDNHGLLAATGQPLWRTIVGGSREYVRRIAAALGDGIRGGHPVSRVTRTATGVHLEVDGASAVAADAVVIATHADDALGLLADASDRERDILGAFRYSTNPAVLHGDERCLPATAAARASWNVTMDDCYDESRPVAITYDLARLQGVRGPLLCTLNGATIAGPVHARMTYTHPILDAAAVAAQPALAAMSGQRRTYFCGAHLRYGFHEDAVMSGLAVARRLEAVA